MFIRNKIILLIILPFVLFAQPSVNQPHSSGELPGNKSSSPGDVSVYHSSGAGGLSFSRPHSSGDLFKRELSSILFTDDAGAIRDPFSGGHNNTEPQFIDIDNDGDLDLFFLNSDETNGWYKNHGTPSSADYHLSPEAIPGVHFNNWFFFLDIDIDNDYDLFTGVPGDFIEFRRNTGTPSTPFFVLEIDSVKEANGSLMYSEFVSNPSFCDIDGDGDYDFFSGNSSGTVNFFENIGTPQNFSFDFITDQWQNIVIISGEGELSPARLHGASSYDFVDIDNDGDFDMFWGDFFSKSLYFIKNNGTPTAPVMEVTRSIYPENADSIWTSGYNMPRFADIDNDGDFDLFVTVLYDPTVPQSLMYYRNNGTAAIADYALITRDYLKTLDGGIQSVSRFIDIDGDGRKDLFIGTARNPEGLIMFFRNTGSLTSPSYALIDSMFAGVHGELSIAPSFADIDGDGDYDLIVGNFDGTFSLYRNTGTPLNPSFIYVDKLKDNTSLVIDIGIYARPVFIDIDNDGDQDFISGRFNGRFSFYRNTGSAQTYIFEQDTAYFSTIDVGDNSSPFLYDYESDGDYDLFSGNRTGRVIYYKNEGNNVTPQWVLNTNNFEEILTGGDSAPVFEDVDNDTDPDLVIGNIKGGLYFYRNSLVSNLKDPGGSVIPDNYIVISAFPNPFNSSISIELQSAFGDYKIRIYNATGELVKELFSGILSEGKHSFNWDGKDNFNYSSSSGVYFITVQNYAAVISKGIILLK